MENRKPRLERAEEAVQAIVAAATHELLEVGFEAITHRRVAELSGANLRSTTYYFKSVKALRREALKLAFALNARGRAAEVENLASRNKSELIDLLLLVTYGKDLSLKQLAVAQKNVLEASIDADYSDLIQQMQTDVELVVQQVLNHFGVKADSKRVIALIDGRIFEHVMSGGKTEIKDALHDDLGI